MRELFFIVLIFFVQEIDGQCSLYPILNTKQEWYMSRTDWLLTFNLTHVFPIEPQGAPLLLADIGNVFRCDVHHLQTATTIFSFRSGRPYTLNGNYLYTCFDFLLTSNVLQFVQISSTGPGDRPVGFKLLPETEGAVTTTICDLYQQAYDPWQYSAFVPKDGDFSITCPTILHGLFTITQTSGTCTSDYTLNGCTDKTAVQKTGSCDINPFYIGSSPGKCVMSFERNGETWVTLYNANSPDVSGRFACVVLSQTDSTVSMSQYPQQCDSTQTATNGQEVFTLTIALTTEEGLSPEARNALIALAVLFVIVIIVVVVVIIICMKRRKRKEKERKRKERRERRRLERMRRRQEREERRRRGLPVSSDSDSDESTDSGYSRSSVSTQYDEQGRILSKDDRNKRDRKKKKKRKIKKLGKKFRRIYDENGKLIREEEIPPDKGDDGNDTVYVITPDGKKIRKRRVKKTRKYVRERTLPNGKTVKELVESDYWETESEHSATSSGEDNPVAAEIREAKRRRKKQRDKMLKRIGYKQQNDEIENQDNEKQHSGSEKDPVKETHDHENQILDEVKGPSTRPRDKTSSQKDDKLPPIHPHRIKAWTEKDKQSSPGFLKKLLKRKKKKGIDEIDEEDMDEEERDWFMRQYRDKKKLEHKLDDEGFWDDGDKKKFAKDIFEIEILEDLLEEKFRQTANQPLPVLTDADQEEPQTTEDNKSKDKGLAQSTTDNTDNHDKISNRRGRHLPGVTFNQKERGKKENTNDETEDAKTKKKVQENVSRMLTERLFPSEDKKSALKLGESKKQGNVIFVSEIHNKPAYGNCLGDGELPPLRQKQGQRSYPGRIEPITKDPEQAAMFRDGLAHDQHILDDIEASQLDDDVDEESVLDDPDHKSRREALGRTKWKNSPNGPNKLFRGPIREAWGNRGSNNGSDKDGSKPKVPYTITAPRFHSYLNFLRGCGQESSQGDTTERGTGSNKKSKRFYMDDARLRRLLEELYKDKKFMDKIIAAEESENEEMVKDLATHGRDYLLDMAMYWERLGPLPPRPSVTALGSRMERSRSMVKEGGSNSPPPPLERNKTFS